ncbi:metal-dependent hydrolase [Halomarina litorea]|uniref:metal-dependent hydrolase n=1 Tax=Halomarina litorea TaxID=2961595 RepID=UPI0020C38F5E|nr:metal-dependent hydrolase [Halomarina sp. BCD28]
MWPWEHLAVGYVLVSLLWRLRGERPDLLAAFAVAFGTQFPDLVDKPLAWVFGVFDSGIAAGHSVLVAVPLCTVLVALAYRAGYVRAAAAFSVGYFSHIPGDAFYPMFYGQPFRWKVFFWPISQGAGEGQVDFLAQVLRFLSRTESFATSPQGATYIGFELLLLLTAFSLWALDGAPGLPRPWETGSKAGER